MLFRRSLYFVRDLEKGSIIEKKDIRSIRPGFGLEPKYLRKVINMKTKKRVLKGDRVSWKILDKK